MYWTGVDVFVDAVFSLDWVAMRSEVVYGVRFLAAKTITTKIRPSRALVGFGHVKSNNGDYNNQYYGCKHNFRYLLYVSFLLFSNYT